MTVKVASNSPKPTQTNTDCHYLQLQMDPNSGMSISTSFTLVFSPYDTKCNGILLESPRTGESNEIPRQLAFSYYLEFSHYLTLNYYLVSDYIAFTHYPEFMHYLGPVVQSIVSQLDQCIFFIEKMRSFCTHIFQQKILGNFRY